MSKRKTQIGFTLIEFIAVMAVIGILAVISIPKINSLSTSAKNSTDDYTIRKLKAVALLLHLKNQAEGTSTWPTGSEISQEVPTLQMTTSFQPNKWCYREYTDYVIFYCDHGQSADSSGRRWWTYYKVDSGGYKAGEFVEGSTPH